MAYQRILTIQDISCVGQCSLTVALPILSACGHETAALPTAVLSTHTGRFQGYTFRDLTDDIPGICAHWEREGLDFSAVYTGYLASARQIALVRDVIRSRLRPGGVLIVDPAMADDGRLYSGFGTDVVDAMRTLCAEADYILPNVTEAALLAGLNLATDPFGAFGDRLLHWFSYDETNNPRVAKLSYLEQHHGEYDSYILGCSSTSSFPVDGFNELYDASFYNLIMYGADMRDCEKIADYLIGHYEVKNLVLNVYLDNGLEYDEESDRLTKNLHYKEDPDTSALSFYTRYLFADPRYALAKLKALRTDTILPQTFDVFDEQTGCYDKRVRDAEPIGAMDSYLERYPVFTDYPHQSLSLPYTDACMQSVAAIKARCEAAGVNLVVVAGPVYAEYLQNYQAEDVAQFYQALAAVTPYWDFSSSSVSCEPRYFYDGTHFRNNVGEMMCARIAGRTDLWMPDDFGTYVTADTPASYFTDVLQPTALTDSAISTRVPILMYHHLAEDVTNDEMVSPEQFEAQIRALSEAGYTGVSFDELQAYVLRGEPLPDKLVVITFDDGYLSNYKYAFPVLKEFGMKAAIFVVTGSVDNEKTVYPHFGYAQAKEMLDSGLIEIGSHTHSHRSFKELSYEETVTELRKSKYLIESELKINCTLLAYPYGFENEWTKSEAIKAGYEIINLVGDKGTNRPSDGLFDLKRLTVSGHLDGEELLEMIEKNREL